VVVSVHEPFEKTYLTRYVPAELEERLMLPVVALMLKPAAAV
jgi:hypothetical protein